MSLCSHGWAGGSSIHGWVPLHLMPSCVSASSIDQVRQRSGPLAGIAVDAQRLQALTELRGANEPELLVGLAEAHLVRDSAVVSPVRPHEPRDVLDVAPLLADRDVAHRDEGAAAVAPVDPLALVLAGQLRDLGAAFAEAPRREPPVRQARRLLRGRAGVGRRLPKHTRTDPGQQPVAADLGRELLVPPRGVRRDQRLATNVDDRSDAEG